MLIFLSGSMNSGKTTTGKALAEKMGAVFINVDDLNDTIPNFNFATDLDKSMDLAIKTINKHLVEGKDVVSNYVLQHKDYVRLKKETKTKRHYFITLAPRLTAIQEQRGDRILSDWEKQRVKYHYDIGIASPSFGFIIDNSELTVNETVDRILQIVNNS